MKKLIFIPVLLIVFTLFSYKDYTACPGAKSSHKAIACSACHGSSVSNDVVVIGGGKDEEEINEEGENDFNFVVKLPNIDIDLIQIATNTTSRTAKLPKVDISLTRDLLSAGSLTLFNAVNLPENKTGKKSANKSFDVSFSFDEAITEAQTLIIQGVISNNDGTVNGDKTFYKEVVIQPKNNTIAPENVEAVNLSIAQEAYYYNNNHIIISSLTNKQVRVIDLQGKVLIDKEVANYENIDVSNLTKGNYFVIVGSTGKDMQSFQFAK